MNPIMHFAQVLPRAVVVTVFPSHRRSPEVMKAVKFHVTVKSLVTTLLSDALMLLMVISSLPNLLTAWYSALYCPSNHTDNNANVFENRTLHESP